MATSDLRTHPIRRQWNEAFCDPHGAFSVTKLMAWVGQVICCYLLLRHAETIIQRWDALTILLTFVIAPELAKRVIMSKYPMTQQAKSAPD